MARARSGPRCGRVDFVAVDRLLRRGMHGRDTRQRRFVGLITVTTSSRPSPGVSPAGPSMPIGIGNAAPEHLIAAAEAEHSAAAAVMRHDIDVPALRAQEREIAARSTSSREGSRGRRRRESPRPAARIDEIDARLELERIEIVEIGDPRQRRDGDLASWRRALRRIARAPAHPRPAARRRRRTRARTPRPARRCACAISSHAARRTARVAAEPVDDEALDHRGIARGRSPLGADEAAR